MSRFAESQATAFRALNSSVAFDQRLWPQDLAGSRAHATMLALGGDLLAAPQGLPGQPPLPQPGAPNGGVQVSNFDTGLLSPYDPSEPKRGVYCDYQRRNNPSGAANCVAPASY